ncbi:MAG: PEP-CTERM sorting domain-containing protein [Candidatus Omnitrophica bacterium]|nr:PEP-CTERM sorting domain-containing protein [Candidatus Omnitrophota bacterium]MDD5574536.1 PEP-CTERM sorting domain-containing protein [Candidatus Omnitrophota bacterium]
MMKTITRVAFLFVVLLAVSGCNQNGVGPGPDEGYVPLSATMGSDDGGDAGATTNGTTDDGNTADGDTGVHTIHNPEPASMLLWGVGLAGAALLRRRRNKMAAIKR